MRKPVSRDRVLSVALDIVDRDGLAQLSMRKVAAAVGVEAMSLYHHVASKADLLDGVFELVLAELPTWKPRSSWREALRDRARCLRDVLATHPNTLPLFATRPAVTPGSLAHLEAALDVLCRAGFKPDRALAMFQALLAYVVGHAMATFASDADAQPRYDALHPADFPRISSLTWKRDLDAEFELGLDAMLAGLAKRTVRS